jgi:MoaA/NifB/PqqE/SkfB family radical SAM enzyme
MRDANRPDPLPREVVLELNTTRLSRPIFWPGRHLDIQRPEMPIALARELFEQLAVLDDTRLTLAGVGDPLLASNVTEIIDAARAAGLAVHLETDLLGPDVEAVRRLAASAIDVVSVHVPALTEETYSAVMGTCGYRRVLEHVHAFVEERAARGRGVPVLAPLFTKCRDNLAEMETWYDQWLRAVGSAVVAGPSDFAGQIRDCAVADMAPPLRRSCARLESRMTVLSDGRIVSCEQDVLGRQALGRLGEDSIAAVWQQQFAKVREEPRKGEWQRRPLCAGCREWHRT